MPKKTDKHVICQECNHNFTSSAQNKNIRCPDCKSNMSFSITDVNPHLSLLADKWVMRCSECQHDHYTDNNINFICEKCGTENEKYELEETY